MKTEDKIYIEKILSEYPRRDNVLKLYDLEIEELKLGIDGGLGAIDYSKDRVQTSNISSTVENQILKLEKDIEDIKKTKNKKSIHFNRIEIALESLTDMQNKLIEYRHFKGYTWGMCAKYIGYSDRQCQNIVNDVMKTLYNYYKIRPSKD